MHACTHTTTTCITGDGSVEWEEKKMTDQYAEEKRWVFSFDLREWRWMPYRDRKRVPDHRSDESKGSLPRVLLPILGTLNIWVSKGESGKESRDEATAYSLTYTYTQNTQHVWQTRRHTTCLTDQESHNMSDRPEYTQHVWQTRRHTTCLTDQVIILWIYTQNTHVWQTRRHTTCLTDQETHMSDRPGDSTVYIHIEHTWLTD